MEQTRLRKGEGVLRPVPHKAFKGVVDKEFVDEEDVPISPVSLLAEIKNLTPFRKAGSLVQCQGHTIKTALASFPDATTYALTNFTLVDHFYFRLSTDSKEVTLLVYQDIRPSVGTGEVRFFINPWWNPLATVTNYNPLTPDGTAATEGAWNTGWFELTEHWSGIACTVSGDTYTVTFPDTGLNTRLNHTGYLNNFFVYMINISGTYIYNQVLSHTYAAGSPGTHTVHFRRQVGGLATAANIIMMVRFPVYYNYKADVTSMYGAGGIFDGLPTQFIYKDNELRMPCGKNNRPLILQFRAKQKYFLGNSNDLSYEGFWFDFQCIPQMMVNSAITSFATRTLGSPTYYSHSIKADGTWDGAATTEVKIQRTSGTGVLQRAYWNTSLPITTVGGILLDGVVNGAFIAIMGSIIYTNGIGTPYSCTAAQFVTLWNRTPQNPLYPIYTASVVTAGTITFNGTGLPQSRTFSSSAEIGQEAGGNGVAFNYFAGAGVSSDDFFDGATTSAGRNVFIANLIIDNRSQILLAHGTICPAAIAGKTPVQIEFDLWFSRRITGWNLFCQKLTAVSIKTGDPAVVSFVGKTDKYPYFEYINKMDNDIRINEVKNFSQYSIFDPTYAIGGFRPSGLNPVRDDTKGLNTYTYDQLTGLYYMQISDAGLGINATDGVGLKYIAACNRFIDQDTTINYTRGVFAGETNGRIFLIGIKNTVEEPVWESNNTIIYSLLATGVSEYDTFLRTKTLDVIGSSDDVITEILYNYGYMAIITRGDYMLLNINTLNEVQYRVIPTALGIGTEFLDAIVSTPDGVVFCTLDTVWLSNRQGQASPILSESNGPLYTYQQTMASATTIQSLYYSAWNELYIVTSTARAGNINIFVYSFEKRMWTVFQYLQTAIAPTKWRNDNNDDITFINWKDITHYNIIKLSESASTFIGTDGANVDIDWKLRTHFAAYSGRVFDTLMSWITLNFDCWQPASPKPINITLYKDAITVYDTDSTTPTAATLLVNLTKEHPFKQTGLASMISLQLDGSGFQYISINSFYLWLTTQPRKLGKY